MLRRSFLLALFVCLLPAKAAHALSLTQVDQSSPWPGVVITQYRTSDPDTDVWVAAIDLCADHVRVEATSAPSSYQTPAAWGAAVGAQLATNGDFYRTGPQIYGDAVGGALSWPLDQTGLDPAYASDWYYKRYGWIAFGHDWVDFTHTEWVKQNASTFGLSDGWEPAVIAPPVPLGTISLVSGFPELVVEGQVITCPSPTDASCFPDRSDMRDRHPRTAMGLTADRQTFLLAVVDGRTAQSAGMYGTELADLMGQLGAYEAFNLDGGGSSQMWVQGQGTVNNASGNNNGGGLRAVANHWGVLAGAASGLPQRPAHCQSEPPCQTIPPPGGIVESNGPCARLFGSSEWWREETSTGYGGHLYWTNAWTSATPSEWAWWQLSFEQAGEYRLEAWVDETFGVFAEVRYQVVADGQETVVLLDQGAAAGWRELGSFHFAQGGGQWLAVYDNTAQSVAADQHITVDAVQLTRLDGWCGDGTCEAGPEDCFSCPTDCPPADEIPNNGSDDDCDGTVDEECGDGLCEAGAEDCFTCPADCPPQSEIPANGIDDDCDGAVDEGADSSSPAADGGIVDDSSGCDCTTGPAPQKPPLWLAAPLLVGLRRRRKPAGGSLILPPRG